MVELTLTEQNFEKEVLKAKQPVLVDFYSDWCPPCKILTPIVEEIAEELSGKIKVAKFNVDQGRSLASQYEIMSIPTLILFKDGQEAKRIIGLRSKEELKKELNG
jgi:thioredoxin 1